MHEDLLVFAASSSGHRRCYVDLLAQEMGGVGLIGWDRTTFRRLIGARRLIIATVECRNPVKIKILLVAAARTFMRRSTVALSVGASGVLNENSNRLSAIGRWLYLKLLGLFPRWKILSIIPHWVEPRLRQLTEGWVYDLQFWDLKGKGLSPNHPARKNLHYVQEIAAGRDVLVAIGSQSARKGGALMMRLYISQPELRSRYLFMICGSLDSELRCLKREFEDHGGICVDRYLTDDQIIACYEESDLIWACYAPDIDQSSGIFGRAIQLQRPMVVRQGSYLEPLMKDLGSGLSIPYDELPNAARRLADFKIEPYNPDRIFDWEKLRQHTIATITADLN
jgi:hypothetical protein